jgi:hypothetical protein
MAYYLVSLKQSILYSLIETDDNGINEINCIIWQKRVI